MSRIYRGLRRAFHRPETQVYTVVETVIFALIAVSILILVLEAVPSLGETPRRVLDVADKFILSLFALELALRVATVRPRVLGLLPLSLSERLFIEVRARVLFMLQPMVLIDLITVLSLFSGLRALRAVRMLRLLRTLKLFRYADPLRAGTAAVRDNSLLYVVGIIFFAASVVLGGLTMYFAELGAEGSKIHDLGDAMWWALVTITTVGYGEITPVTGMGRVVASFLMLDGMFCLATFAGIVGHTLLSNLMTIRKEQLRMSTRTGHIVVLGYESSALPLLEALEKEFPSDDQPMVIFSPLEPVQEIPDRFTWVPGDPTKESELDKVRLAYARAAVVMGRGLGRDLRDADAVTLLSLFTLRSYMEKKDREGFKRRIPLQVVAEILDPENVQHALVSGADEVVQTARLGLSVLGHTVAMPGTGTALDLVISDPAQKMFVGPLSAVLDEIPAAYGDLVALMKDKHDVLVMGVQDPSTDVVTLNAQSDHKIYRETRMVYLAPRALMGHDAGERWKLED